MKKTLFLFSAIACLVSCTQQSVAPQPPPSPPAATSIGSPPIIHFYGVQYYITPLDSAYALPVPFGFDAEDGDITAQITHVSAVDIHTIGMYPVIYSLMDSDSNLVHDTIIVQVDTGMILFQSPYIVQHDSCVGHTLNDPGMYAEVVMDPSVSNGILINGFGAHGFAVTIPGVMTGNTISFGTNIPLDTWGTLLWANGTITDRAARQFTITYAWTDGVNTFTNTCHYAPYP